LASDAALEHYTLESQATIKRTMDNGHDLPSLLRVIRKSSSLAHFPGPTSIVSGVASLPAFDFPALLVINSVQESLHQSKRCTLNVATGRGRGRGDKDEYEKGCLRDVPSFFPILFFIFPFFFFFFFFFFGGFVSLSAHTAARES
jgi:hypothetical protein